VNAGLVAFLLLIFAFCSLCEFVCGFSFASRCFGFALFMAFLLLVVAFVFFAAFLLLVVAFVFFVAFLLLVVALGSLCLRLFFC
jgi:hypothetical protein